ncbi:hypothetical protein DV726_25840, partial [Klebsiella pneumoniae]|nr:hypothetical protein [Klebsiella pneumoniae]
RPLIEAVYFLEVHQARNSSRRGNKIPFRRRIDSSKPTCRQNRCCKNGSDHRFRFLRRPLVAVSNAVIAVLELIRQYFD